MTLRGLGADAAESRYTRRSPFAAGVSKIGKSARSAAPSKPSGLRVPRPCGTACCSAIDRSFVAGLRVRTDRLGLGRLVADSGRRADLLADPVVAVGLELMRQLLAAGHDHPAVEH